MGIFNKKREYVVVTDMTMSSLVREFAEAHCADGCEVDVHIHGCAIEGENLVTITFKSDQGEAIVYSDLIDAFMDLTITGGKCRLAIRRKLIFVFKNEEEEESE